MVPGLIDDNVVEDEGEDGDNSSEHSGSGSEEEDGVVGRKRSKRCKLSMYKLQDGVGLELNHSMSLWRSENNSVVCSL